MADWGRTHLSPNPADGNSPRRSPDELSSRQKVEIALKLSKKKSIDLENERKSGKLHDIEECTRRSARKVHLVREQFMSVADRAPAETPPAVREWIRNDIRRICELFAAGGVN